ncbi:undecaprenyl-diphosphatase [Flavobacteriaceae bacterium MAR_2010_188]|nr:undecaprenyl-diphosphatase [Flavobacteriaceae bacterium MAR_2010_188]
MRKSLIAFLRKLKEILVNTFHQYNKRLPYIITLLLALFIVVGGVNLFIELTDTLTTDTLAEYDRVITDYVISYRDPLLTKYFRFVTEVGDLYGYIVVFGIVVIIAGIIYKRWGYVSRIAFVLIMASVSNVILKRFVDRARPGIEHLVSVETLSYPSGHAMSAMAFYGFVMFLFYRFKMNHFLKFLIIFLLGILILSIGLSRIYLGVHFPSDVVGGYLAGFIWVVFCVLVFDIIEIFRRDPST